MNVLRYLEELRLKELIGLEEVEFVRFLREIEPDTEEEVFLAAALCIHAQKNGHVCLDLDNWNEKRLFGDAESELELTESTQKKWLQKLSESKLVSTGKELTPLVLEKNRLYLHRFWKYEEKLSGWIKEKAKKINKVENDEIQVLQNILPQNQDLFEVNWQHVAVCLSFLKDLVLISGGPGTGKTFTVLNIIAAHTLAHSNDKKFRIALAAPTGKAARRLNESIVSGKEHLPENIAFGFEIPEAALTVHKLLGSDFRGSRFKYNEENKLPYDMVIIDEASMLDITMWVRLISAAEPNTKLVILGDKDQLASVEAGSILGDICGGENSFSKEIVNLVSSITGMNVPVSDQKISINDCVVFLTKSYRFEADSGIQRFANAVNNSDADKAVELLRDGKYNDLNWLSPTPENLEKTIQNYAIKHYDDFISQPGEQQLSYSSRKKILCALRRGPFGVEEINSWAERQIRRNHNLLKTREWYPGRLIMATRNDAMLKLRNGEIGMCVTEKEPAVKFEGEDRLAISAARLNAYEPAYAITIHKSQGSEFDEVAILLPNRINTILSKEILYTAVTRARSNTLIIANKEILRKTINRSVSRNSGVRKKIWGN